MSLSNEEQLGVALRAQSSRDNDPDIAERICEEIKQSTIFRHNWQALLQSAPVAISATGACYAACFSEAGQRVTLNLPLSGHFKYLEYRSLSANLLACGDRGRFAFLEAETGLAFVKDFSTRAENKVGHPGHPYIFSHHAIANRHLGRRHHRTSFRSGSQSIPASAPTSDEPAESNGR
jgi:hypothetical protein